MCDYCDKPFPNPEELKQHMEDHLKKAQGQLDDEEQSDSDCIEANIENDEIDLEENAHENEEIDLEENAHENEKIDLDENAHGNESEYEMEAAHVNKAENEMECSENEMEFEVKNEKENNERDENKYGDENDSDESENEDELQYRNENELDSENESEHEIENEIKNKVENENKSNEMESVNENEEDSESSDESEDDDESDNEFNEKEMDTDNEAITNKVEPNNDCNADESNKDGEKIKIEFNEQDSDDDENTMNADSNDEEVLQSTSENLSKHDSGINELTSEDEDQEKVYTDLSTSKSHNKMINLNTNQGMNVISNIETNKDTLWNGETNGLVKTELLEVNEPTLKKEAAEDSEDEMEEEVTFPQLNQSLNIINQVHSTLTLFTMDNATTANNLKNEDIDMTKYSPLATTKFITPEEPKPVPASLLKPKYKQTQVFSCHICHKTQKSKIGLTSHLAVEHYRVKLLQIYVKNRNMCRVCQVKNNNQNVMLRHIANKHNGLKTFIDLDSKPTTLPLTGETPSVSKNVPVQDTVANNDGASSAKSAMEFDYHVDLDQNSYVTDSSTHETSNISKSDVSSTLETSNISRSDVSSTPKTSNFAPNISESNVGSAVETSYIAPNMSRNDDISCALETSNIAQNISRSDVFIAPNTSKNDVSSTLETSYTSQNISRSDVSYESSFNSSGNDSTTADLSNPFSVYQKMSHQKRGQKVARQKGAPKDAAQKVAYQKPKKHSFSNEQQRLSLSGKKKSPKLKPEIITCTTCNGRISGILKRKMRCRTCPPCLRENCNICKPCLTPSMKKACIHKECDAPVLPKCTC